MLDLIEYVVKSLVKNKDAVNITEKQEGKTKVYLVTVDKADIGAVIGKPTNTANQRLNRARKKLKEILKGEEL